MESKFPFVLFAPCTVIFQDEHQVVVIEPMTLLTTVFFRLTSDSYLSTAQFNSVSKTPPDHECGKCEKSGN